MRISLGIPALVNILLFYVERVQVVAALWYVIQLHACMHTFVAACVPSCMSVCSPRGRETFAPIVPLLHIPLCAVLQHCTFVRRVRKDLVYACVWDKLTFVDNSLQVYWDICRCACVL